MSKGNLCISTVRVYLDEVFSPVNNWSDFNKIYTKIQSDLCKAGNRSTMICNMYACFALSQGKDSADNWLEDTYGTRKIGSALYKPARLECPNLLSGSIASFTNEIYSKYFTGVNSYINKIKKAEGNPPMSYTKSLPVPLISANAKIIRSEGKPNRYYDISFGFLSKDGVKAMSEMLYEHGSMVKVDSRLVFRTKAMDNSTYKILENIVSGSYKLCGSKIICTKNRRASSCKRKDGRNYQYILQLSYSHPVENHDLNPEYVMGVDLGIQVPAMCGVNYNDYYRRSLGGRKILDENMRQHAINKKKQKEITYNGRDGHGRSSKLDGWDGSGHKINNRNDTYNHVLSHQIVEQAIKWQCATIQMEDLSGITGGVSDRLLKSWPYYDLQMKVEYKAKENGIAVKYIKPYHTSTTCSKCGHDEFGNRPKGEKGQAYFKCLKCGYSVNADFNAARNIAMSDNYSKKTARKVKDKISTKGKPKSLGSEVNSLKLDKDGQLSMVL